MGPAKEWSRPMNKRIHRNVRTLHFHQRNCLEDQHHPLCPRRTEGAPRTVYRPKSRPAAWAPVPVQADLGVRVDADYLSRGGPA